MKFIEWLSMHRKPKNIKKESGRETGKFSLRHFFGFLAAMLLFLFLAWVLYDTNVVNYTICRYPIIKRVDLHSRSLMFVSSGDEFVQTVSVNTSQRIDGLGIYFDINAVKDDEEQTVVDEENHYTGSVHLTVLNKGTKQVYYEGDIELEDLEDRRPYVVNFDPYIEDIEGDSLTFIINADNLDENDTNLAIVSMYSKNSQEYVMGDNNSFNHTSLCFCYYSKNFAYLAKCYILMILWLALGFTVLYFAIEKYKLPIQWAFVIIMIFCGLTYSMIMTPNSIPDENAHFQQAYYYSDIFMGTGTPGIDGKLFMRKCDTKLGSLFDGVSLDSMRTTVDGFLGRESQNKQLIVTSYVPVKNAPFWLYIPQILGISLARAMNLDFIPLYYMGRMFNFIGYVVLTFWTIKRTPVGKYIFLTLSVLPMTMQLVGSYSNSAAVIALILFFIANCLYAVYSTKSLKWVDIIVLAASSAVMSVLKVGVYLPLCMMVLMIPRRKFTTKKEWILTLVILCVIPIVPFVLYKSSSIQHYMGGGSSGGEETRYTVSYILKHPRNFLLILENTLLVQSDFYYLSTIGKNLGWFNVPITYITVGYFTVLLLASACRVPNEVLNFKIWHFWWMAILGIASIGLMCVGMLVGWTSYPSLVIEGVQGRYIIPVLVLPLLFVKRSNLEYVKDPVVKYSLAVYGGELLALISMLYNIMSHYTM